MSRGSDKSLSPGDSTLLGMGYMLCLRRDLMEVFIHFFFFFFRLNGADAEFDYYYYYRNTIESDAE